MGLRRMTAVGSAKVVPKEKSVDSTAAAAAIDLEVKPQLTSAVAAGSVPVYLSTLRVLGSHVIVCVTVRRWYWIVFLCVRACLLVALLDC